MKALDPFYAPVLIAALVGCSSAPQPPTPNNAAQPQNMASETSSPVYVAHAPADPRTSLTAQFEGHYLVRNGCLLFETDGRLYLPVFATQTDVQVFADHLIIAGQRSNFETMRRIGGGELPANFASQLRPPTPPICTYPLLRL
jgi:hypothetical protein